jgi:heavy metal translocating P-type ATPase
VVRKGKTLSVPVSEIKVGEKIIIRAGELVPVDAVVIDGSASFDESSLTGESLPRVKDVGDSLLSGSINMDGAITAKSIASAEDSQYQQIIKLVRSAAASQAPFVRLADRYSLPFTFLAYAIASGVWLLSGDSMRFLEVIIVATPCPLLLAAPIALISGMSRASRYGIIVKTGSALERLAAAKTIAFDKTGTLTRGELAVEGIEVFGAHSEEAVLKLAASLEQNSTHVVAQALVAYSQEKGIKLSKAKHVQEISGRGVKATISGQEIIVGRLSLLEEKGVTLPTGFNASRINQTAAYVAIDGELAGVVLLQDEIRPEAKATIESLHAMGVRNIMMVTGDNRVTAERIAKQLGIDEVHAETLPADKLRIVQSAVQRPIAFVGDGVNDAPVLTGADVGIALGARGSAAASESADMVIMLDDVNRVAGAYAIANRTFRIARQSILIGIGLSIILMLAFATGKFTPLTGAIIQEVVDVIVIFYALRAHMITIGE